MRRTFGHSVDDPLGYDVVVNAATGTAESIADWLAAASARKFEKMRPQMVPSR